MPIFVPFTQYLCRSRKGRKKRVDIYIPLSYNIG